GGVPSAGLGCLRLALASEHVQQGGFVQTTVAGVDVPTLPFRLGGAPAYQPTRPAPTRGEHTDEILAWLDR
ncbi:MAG: CoA transferase, partial [Pseudomonadota bacterium]